MKVNAEAEGIEPLRQRIRELEQALQPFVCATHYMSGIDSRTGDRWCQSRVTADDMARARGALAQSQRWVLPPAPVGIP